MGSCLLADDDPLSLSCLAMTLGRHGYEVMTATNGDAALRLAQERRPSVVLLDIKMPGLDGLEVLGAMRRTGRTRDTPVIMLTARDEEDDLIEALNRGADDYITKPVLPRDLMGRIDDVIAARAA